MAQQHSKADPEAVALARLVQAAVPPDTVILFGSRALGDHRPDSDKDLLITTASEKASWIRGATPRR